MIERNGELLAEQFAVLGSLYPSGRSSVLLCIPCALKPQAGQKGMRAFPSLGAARAGWVGPRGRASPRTTRLLRGLRCTPCGGAGAALPPLAAEVRGSRPASVLARRAVCARRAFTSCHRSRLGECPTPACGARVPPLSHSFGCRAGHPRSLQGRHGTAYGSCVLFSLPVCPGRGAGLEELLLLQLFLPARALKSVLPGGV